MRRKNEQPARPDPAILPQKLTEGDEPPLKRHIGVSHQFPEQFQRKRILPVTDVRATIHHAHEDDKQDERGNGNGEDARKEKHPVLHGTQIAVEILRIEEKREVRLRVLPKLPAIIREAEVEQKDLRLFLDRRHDVMFGCEQLAKVVGNGQPEILAGLYQPRIRTPEYGSECSQRQCDNDGCNDIASPHKFLLFRRSFLPMPLDNQPIL